MDSHLTPKERQKETETFGNWLNAHPAFIEEFLHSLPVNISARMDFSLDSLDLMEAYILKEYVEAGTIMDDTSKEFVNNASVYLGEVMCRILHATWDIELDDPENVFFKMPVVKYGKHGKHNPMSLICACPHRRNGHYLRGVVENSQKWT